MKKNFLNETNLKNVFDKVNKRYNSSHQCSRKYAYVFKSNFLSDFNVARKNKMDSSDKPTSVINRGNKKHLDCRRVTQNWRLNNFYILSIRRSFFLFFKKRLKEIRSSPPYRVTLRLLFRAVVLSEFPQVVFSHTPPSATPPQRYSIHTRTRAREKEQISLS